MVLQHRPISFFIRGVLLHRQNVFKGLIDSDYILLIIFLVGKFIIQFQDF